MKTKIIKATTVIGALLFLCTLNLNAQSSKNTERGKKPPTFKQLLKEMDTDEDGKLSKSEIKGPLKEGFEKVDTDEDGFITEEEFKKAPKPKRRERTNN